MSQWISADQQVINFAKYWYTDRKFENLLVRNDPFAELMTKTRIGGQAYRFAAMYGRGEIGRASCRERVYVLV